MRHVLFAFALASLLGCPGKLDDPDQYPEQPLDLCLLDIDVPALLRARCGNEDCHGSTSPAAQLDLNSPGIFERMENASATQCEDRVRIDPLDPNNSFLMEKIRGTQPPTCGQTMPPFTVLTTYEVGCIQLWLFEKTVGLDGGPPVADMGSE
ncbi:MAG: hypothetical protein JJ863_35235 [Deltaproteobacteria bacterium]|nr:hypothetical protein [Deltaproteobacteria bacterium]